MIEEMVNKIKDSDLETIYAGMFGDVPKQTITIAPNNEIYIKLMRNALINEKEITQEDIDNALKNVDYDYVVDDEELSARAYAEKYSKE